MSGILKSVQTPFTVIVVFFIIFFAFVKVFGPIPFSINSVSTTKYNLFQVSGTGEVSDAPDSATVSFGVTKSANTISYAQNQTNTNITSIISALKNEGVEDKNIKTTDYNLVPNYDFNSGRQNITGYTVTQTVELTIQPLEKVNKIMDIITAKGANIVNQVAFTFSDAKKKDLENKARQLAVGEAKTKAESLAQAAGIRLGPIIDVTEDNSQQPRPIMPLVLTKDEAASGTPTQVTPGENSISLTVTLTYQTY